MPQGLVPKLIAGAWAAFVSRQLANHGSIPAMEAENGDVIKVDRGLYDHYGVYVTPCRRVIHYTGATGPADFNGVVRETSLEEFLNGAEGFTVCRFPEYLENVDELAYPATMDIPVPGSFVPDWTRGLDKMRRMIEKMHSKGERAEGYRLYSGEETVRRARSKLGEGGYNLLCNNCEHFAIWCKTGLRESTQVNQAMELLLSVLSAGAGRVSRT